MDDIMTSTESGVGFVLTGEELDRITGAVGGVRNKASTLAWLLNADYPRLRVVMSGTDSSGLTVSVISRSEKWTRHSQGLTTRDHRGFFQGIKDRFRDAIELEKFNHEYALRRKHLKRLVSVAVHTLEERGTL